MKHKRLLPGLLPQNLTCKTEFTHRKGKTCQNDCRTEVSFGCKHFFWKMALAVTTCI